MSVREPSVVLKLLTLLINRVFPWVLAIVLVVAVRDAAMDLAKAPSLLAAWVELTGRVKATRPFAFLFGALGIAYGLQQRNLRRAVEARLARRIPELERIIEQHRTTRP